MALYQELRGQGRVIGGYLAGGTVMYGGSTPFSKHGDLSIQHSSNPFKRQKINAETVSEWDVIDAKEGVAGLMGQAAAMAAIPGRTGRAVGAGLSAAFNSGHTVRLVWADGKQSIVGFPEKQFMVLSTLLKDLQVIPEPSETPEPDVPLGVAERIAGLASSVLARGRQRPAASESEPVPDVTEQIAKLSSLHAQGILTDADFSDKKAELLKRL